MPNEWDDSLYEWCVGCSSYYSTGHLWTRENVRCQGYYQEYCKRHILKLKAVKANLTHMVEILDMDMIHANTMIKIEYAKELLEILGSSEFKEDGEPHGLEETTNAE